MQKRLFSGWGAGIRTPEVPESESGALPLGYTPIFSCRYKNDIDETATALMVGIAGFEPTK